MQAAGRCTREGRRPLEDSIVTVFSAPDYPPPREIRSLIGDTARALKDFQGNTQSLEAIRKFFGEVYIIFIGRGIDAGFEVDIKQVFGDDPFVG